MDIYIYIYIYTYSIGHGTHFMSHGIRLMVCHMMSTASVSIMSPTRTHATDKIEGRL